MTRQPVLRDWRGQLIEVGTRFIWRSGTANAGTWGIGRVTAIREAERWFDPAGRWLLDAEWEERSRSHIDESSGLKAHNITVLPAGTGS